MRGMLKVIGCSVAAALVLASNASAAFAPTTDYSFTSTKSGKATGITMAIAIPETDEHLKSVQVSLPKGYDMPDESEIADGTEIGTVSVATQAGPGCVKSEAAEANQSEELPAKLLKVATDGDDFATWQVLLGYSNTQEVNSSAPAQDLSQTNQDQQKIAIHVQGSKAQGWTLGADISDFRILCGSTVTIEIPDALEDGSVLLTNPKLPAAKKKVRGKKVFKVKKKSYTITTEYSSHPAVGANAGSTATDTDKVTITR